MYVGIFQNYNFCSPLEILDKFKFFSRTIGQNYFKNGYMSVKTHNTHFIILDLISIGPIVFEKFKVEKT